MEGYTSRRSERQTKSRYESIPTPPYGIYDPGQEDYPIQPSHRQKYSARSSERELFYQNSADVPAESTDQISLSTSSSRLQFASNERRVGQPQELASVVLLDLFAVSACIVISIITFMTVFYVKAAIIIGQAYQLIIVGLCLTLMGLCFQYLVKKFLIALAVLRGPPTLQVLDGIIQMDPFIQHQAWSYRIAIFGLFLVLPLQGIFYKFAQGGQILSEASLQPFEIGITGPPGTQNIGQGHALFHNATLPWFSDPGFDRTYGFNMYVQSENVTALLDGIMPKLVLAQQKSLRLGDSVQVTATVTAVVCEIEPLTQPDRRRIGDRFNQIRDDYWISSSNWIYNDSYAYAIMINDRMDQSQIWMSWWRQKRESFSSQVNQYRVSRKQYIGHWTITQQTISLTSASPHPNPTPDPESKDIIEHNTLAVVPIYLSALAEYDYRFRPFGYARAQNNSKYATYVRNDASILASMVWSRIIALNGPQNMDPIVQNYDHDDLWYNRDVYVQMSRIALKREPWLAAVFLFYPVCCVVVFLVRLIWLNSAPVSNGFGLVSVLAAANPQDLQLVRGAGLSGKVNQPVYVHMTTQASEEFSTERIRLRLALGRADVGTKLRLRKNRFYE